MERRVEQPAEAGQGDAQAVGVDLSGDHHGAGGVDGEPVRGPAPAAAGRAGVDRDQPERLQFGGDGAGGGPGDVERAGERRAGRGLAGVDQLERRTEQRPAAVGGRAAVGVALRVEFGPGPGLRT